MKLVKIAVGSVAVLGWLAVGLLVARGPQPEIVVPAEILTKIGPLNISNSLLTAWVVMAILTLLSLAATRSMSLVPSGVQNFMEGVVGFLVGQVEEIAGHENGRKFFMVVATIFLFVITSNWLGLLPFFNAIGKTEDVNHHILHVIATQQASGEPFEEADKFGAWFMDNTGGITMVKAGAKATEFEIEAGDTAGVAADRYIVYLAQEFADFKPDTHGGEAHGAPDKATVNAALDALEANPKAPKVYLSATEASASHSTESHSTDGHASEGEHLPVSGALNRNIEHIEFRGQVLGLVIPYFRSPFSDVNNTLAMGIVAFLCIEFWGFQALGFGYLKKFFNLNGVNSFVGILELLSEFIRVISFAFRLFGNVFAGEVLILMLTFLMPFLFVDIIYGLELFVGFIQAAVFALLTLVFAVGAVEHHGDEEHHDGHHGDADGHHPEGAVQAH